MSFGLVLLLVGGFLLGGAWSVWRGDPETAGGRSGAQVAFALLVVVAAVLASVAGILRLV